MSNVPLDNSRTRFGNYMDVEEVHAFVREQLDNQVRIDALLKR